MENWIVYMIHCTDGSLYTGISTNVEKRYKDHALQQGAKYFRGRKPKALVFQERGHDRSTASKRELEIKSLTRTEKIQLIHSTQNEITIVGDIT